MMFILSAVLFVISVILSFCLSKLYEKYKAYKQKLEKAEKEKDIIFSFLQEIGAAFTEGLNLDVVLGSVLKSVVRILKAKSGAIFLIDDAGKYLQASIIEGIFPPWQRPDDSIIEKIISKTKYLEDYLKGQKISLGTGIIGLTAERGELSLISNAAMDSRVPKFTEAVLEIETMLLVPLKIKDNIMGVLALANKENEDVFTETDAGLLQALADLSSISIRNAKFYKTVIEKQKLDRDLVIAKDIQRMLLPRKCPDIDRWDIGVLSKNAMEIGGDYYDFIDVGKDKLGVVIADVAGKSIPGALVMSMTRSIIRTKAIGVNSASSVIMSANELICQDVDPDMFISLVYLIIDTSRNNITYARAGHEPIIHYHAKESTCELIKPEGMVLGINCDSLFNNSLKEADFQMCPGDILILYTDGITEAVNEKQEEFGLSNLLDSIKIASNGSAQDIVKNIQERITRFTGGIPQKDDITLVVMKLKG